MTSGRYHGLIPDFMPREIKMKEPEMTTQLITIEVGAELFDFPTFDNWCDTARQKFAHACVGSKDVLAIDARGRVCQIGLEFIRARDDKAFPVRVFRMVTSARPNP